MTIRGRVAIAAAAIAMASALVAGGSATATDAVGWKGGDSLVLTGLVPDEARCGRPSLERPVFEAQLSGTGIDSVAGAFVVTASACVDLDTLRVTGLEATDTFTTGSAAGASITIASDDFTFERNDVAGVVFSAQPVGFRVIAATGKLAGTTGEGHYDIALSWPASRGLPQPAHVWFEGTLLVP